MSNLTELDKAHHLHPFTSISEQQSGGSHLIVSGNGIRLKDDKGSEYIDAMAGLWCVNAGYGRTEIADAMAEQSRKLSYYHSFMSVGNEPSIRLAERLANLAPGDLNKVFFGCSGSDCNDTFIKLIWLYNNLRGKPEKKKFISRHNSYHGVSVAAAGLSGLPHLRARFDLPLSDRFVLVRRPHYYWDAVPGMTEEEFSAALGEDLRQTINREGAENIAAFIAEPVMGAAGVVVPPKGYFETIIPILREHDILMISDEVVCGFGRLGRWFGCEYFGFQPDLMTTAKGLTSGYFPLSAGIVSDKIWKVLADASAEAGPFAHGYTYTAHPTGAATANANLDLIQNEGLIENALKVGAYLQSQLEEKFSGHPMIGEKRGIGLIAALELVKDKKNKVPFDPKENMGRRLYNHLLAEGLICRPIGNTLAFSPPLIVTGEDIDVIVTKFGRGLDKLSAEIR